MRHIEVEYQDGTHAFVDDYQLENLIRQSKIEMFYRPSEKKWAVIGVDPIRSGAAGPRNEIERRRTGPFRQMVPVELLPGSRASR